MTLEGHHYMMQLNTDKWRYENITITLFCYNHSKAVKLLIGMHADPHIRDSDQLTPADLAEDGGFYECAEYLKKQPPNPVIEVEVNVMLKLETIIIIIIIIIIIERLHVDVLHAHPFAI